MITTFPVFGQRNYPDQLGSGNTQPLPTIRDYGCVLCSLTACLYYFGKPVDPLSLNQKLIQVSGYANNGNGDFDLVIWPKITDIYPDVPLFFNNSYPTSPADMGLIDAQLSRDIPVIVGVPFLHNPANTQPTHYVTIFRKNNDGSYSCSDPWYDDVVSFDARYAVNGMSVAQAILQAISYNGPMPAVSPQEPGNTTPLFNDQTKIPIGGKWGDMELQAVRSTISDQDRTLSQQNEQRVNDDNKISSLTNQISDLTLANKNQADTLVDLQDQLSKCKNTQPTPPSQSPKFNLLPFFDQLVGYLKPLLDKWK